jgi:hypothetical protein
VRRGAPYAVLLVVLAVLTHRAAGRLHNADTFFHLRFGHEWLTSWSLRDPGSVSSYATADWVPTQWLPQVAMAAVEDGLGLAGVAWLSGLGFVALALTWYAVARRDAEPLVAAPVVALALIASSGGLSARPQVLSYLLVAVTAAAWLGAVHTRRAPWWVVPLTWVWAMCHGMWPVGLVVGGLVVLVGLRTVRAAAVVALSGVAALLTPVGPPLVSAVLAVGDRRRFFGEWGTPDPSDPRLLPLAALLVATAVLTLRPGHRDATRTGLLLLALACAVWSTRTVPVAAALVVPLAAAALQPLLGPRPGWTRPERVVALGGAATALAVLALVVPRTAAAPPPVPAWADPALDALPAGTPILNGWDLGGWLMWRHPQLDPVMHGYGDTFTVAELQRNADIEATRPGWATLVRATGVAHALVRPGTHLARGLVVDEHWRVVHRSADLVLLVPPPGWM